MMHQQAERDVVQPLERFREAFIVPRQTAQACHPAERTLHHPTPGQQHETLLGLGQLDDLQVDAVARRVPIGIIAGVALGVIEVFTAAYISSGLKEAVAFAILVAVLWTRPQGLFGRAVVRRA